MSNTLLSPLPSLRLSDDAIPPATATLADGTLSLDLGRQNPDPSARRHGGPHGTHANQNHRPRYPFKPAVPSESGQLAQNLALNPHRPTLPPTHTPPAVSSFEAFRTPASVQPLAQ